MGTLWACICGASVVHKVAQQRGGEEKTGAQLDGEEAKGPEQKKPDESLAGLARLFINDPSGIPGKLQLDVEGLEYSTATRRKLKNNVPQNQTMRRKLENYSPQTPTSRVETLHFAPLQ